MSNTNIPTPHIECRDENLIAKTVLLPGDPLRAKFIADNFLTDVVKFNGVRNMFGYTGKYNGKLISVMGSGMGMASLGIYAYELYSFYGVENIVRIGSAGAYSKDLAVYDTVLIKDAWSESTFAKVAFGYEEDVLSSNDELNKYFTISGMPVVSSQYWNSIHGNNAQEAEQDEEGKQTMRALARNMTFLMKSIALGKEAYGLPEKEIRKGTNFIR